jgi:hypothetical protein
VFCNMHHEILLQSLWLSIWCKFFYLGSSSSSSDWLIDAQFCIWWWSWCWFLWHSRSIKLTSACLSAWQQQLWEATDRSFSVLMWIRTWVCNCGHLCFVCLFVCLQGDFFQPWYIWAIATGAWKFDSAYDLVSFCSLLVAQRTLWKSLSL